MLKSRARLLRLAAPFLLAGPGVRPALAAPSLRAGPVVRPALAAPSLRVGPAVRPALAAPCPPLAPLARQRLAALAVLADLPAPVHLVLPAYPLDRPDPRMQRV